jgi:hypothetical protein
MMARDRKEKDKQVQVKAGEQVVTLTRQVLQNHHLKHQKYVYLIFFSL